MAEQKKLDITTLRQDIAERERQRQQAEEERIAEQRKARLDDLAKKEIAARERRIKDLDKAKTFLQRNIAQLTEGGRISNQKQLQDAVDGYNASLDEQERLSLEAAEIAKGNYRVSNNKIVVEAPVEAGRPSVRPESLPTGFGTATAPTQRTGAATDVEQKVAADEQVTQRQTRQTRPSARPGVTTEEAPAKDKGKGKKAKPQSISEIYDQVRKVYANVDSIFLYEPELQKLLRKAIGADGVAGTEDDYTNERFTAELAATDWAKRGAPIYRQREAEKREYNDQLSKYQKQLALAVDPQKQADIQEKIDELKTNSNYARGLEKTKGVLQNIITEIGATYSPEQLDLLTRRFYDSATENDTNKVINVISGNIGVAPGGFAGEKLTELRATAKANGIDFDKVYGSNAQEWLARLAQGESVNTYKNLIRQQAKLGLPEKVAALLDQGLDLEQVYAPYKNLMASYLEIPAQNIDLNDRTLRSAIGPEKEMSLYDFERTLRNDSRWEFTNNAREEVSSNVLDVLRSFGFQG